MATEDRLTQARGGKALTFDQYYDSLVNAAVMHDARVNRSTSSRTRGFNPTRTVNYTDLGMDDPYEGCMGYEDADPQELEEPGADYVAYLASRTGTRDPKRPWIPAIYRQRK